MPAPCKHKHCFCLSMRHEKLCQTHRHCQCVCIHACCAHVCVRMDVCVQTGAALGVAGLADCCIIFGKAPPSLWRASLKSAGPLRLPLSGSGSSAKPSQAGSLAAAAHNPVELWPVRGPAPTILCYTQMARLLIGSQALHFHWCSASGSGDPTPSLNTATQMQSSTPPSARMLPVSIVGAMIRHNKCNRRQLGHSNN